MSNKKASSKAKVSKKYALTPSARLQRKQAAKKSAEARRVSGKEWVGTSMTVKNKEYAVTRFGSPDEAINTLRTIEESLVGISIEQFLKELASARKEAK